MRLLYLPVIAFLIAFHLSCKYPRYLLQNNETYEVVHGQVVEIQTGWLGLSCEQHHESYVGVLFKLSDGPNSHYILIKYHQREDGGWAPWTRNKGNQTLKLIKPNNTYFDIWNNLSVPGFLNSYSAGPPPPPKHIVTNYPAGENPPYGQQFQVYCYFD